MIMERETEQLLRTLNYQCQHYQIKDGDKPTGKKIIENTIKMKKQYRHFLTFINLT